MSRKVKSGHIKVGTGGSGACATADFGTSWSAILRKELPAVEIW